MKKQVFVGIAVAGLLFLFALSFMARDTTREPFLAAAAVAAVAGSSEPQAFEKPTPQERWITGPKKGAPLTVDISGEASELAVPYAQGPINSLDDYEYNFVYQNESDRPLSTEMRNKLMSQYPLDWSGYPPSSSQFQAGLRESFENATPTVPDDAKPYMNISGSTMSPPDTGAMEAEERKILMTYKPTFPPDPTAYDPEDVNDVVTKIYKTKGLVPQIKRRGDTNVYDIVDSRPIGEKVVYEDDCADAPSAPASTGAVTEAGEGPIQAPAAVGQDRFFEAGATSGRMNKWDYTAWTPGLERSFAPTAPQQNWY